MRQHTVSRTGAYNSWQNMLTRCRGTSSINRPYYLEKGIAVCKEWLSFANFYADMGERPPGKTLDREDNAKGYYKDNCRWATPSEQQNNKDNTVSLTFNSITMTLAEWAKHTGLPRNTIGMRKKYGWTDKEILTTPVRKHTRKPQRLEGLKENAP